MNFLCREVQRDCLHRLGLTGEFFEEQRTPTAMNMEQIIDADVANDPYSAANTAVPAEFA
jgi:hypothetical protein